MPDPNLRAEIRQELKLGANDVITRKVLRNLIKLVANGRGIESINGLEFATNLQHLQLRSNHIVDIRPLANLRRLHTLIILDNHITDLRPLSNLTELVELNARDNPISDVSPVSNLRKLKYLDLSRCNIVDLQPLADLTQLHVLQLNHNNIVDIRPLASLTRLYKLELQHNFITDFSPVSHLTLDTFYFDQYCILPRLPLLPRLTGMTFSTVFMPTWFMPHDSGSHMPFSPADQFFDMAYRSADSQLVSDNLYNSIAIRDAIIANNPTTVFLAYLPWHKAYFTQLPKHSMLWARNISGELLLQDFATGAYLDYTNPLARALVVKMASDIDKCGLYDGIVLDAWGYDLLPTDVYSSESQTAARLALVKEIRAVTRPNFLIQVNSNRNRIPDTALYINGLSMETGIPGWFDETDVHLALRETAHTLLWAESNLRYPQINGVVGWAILSQSPHSLENQRWMRLLTALTLTHSNGFTLYQHGPNTWYDFWDADLGRPVGEKAQVYEGRSSEGTASAIEIPGLYIREYTNGWAVYNHSGAPQVITLPEEVQGVASGLVNVEHALPNLDGEMYLRVTPKNPADVNGDGVVNVFDLVFVANQF